MPRSHLRSSRDAHKGSHFLENKKGLVVLGIPLIVWDNECYSTFGVNTIGLVERKEAQINGTEIDQQIYNYKLTIIN